MSDSSQQQPSRPFPLYKQLSWSPDADRDEAWLRRKTQFKNRRSKSVTDDDLEELKACIDLGFGFDSPDMDRRLYDTFPALSFYRAINKRYTNPLSSSSSSPDSESTSSSSRHNPAAIISHGDSPEMVKERLRQWAQVVACSVRQN